MGFTPKSLQKNGMSLPVSLPYLMGNSAEESEAQWVTFPDDCNSGSLCIRGWMPFSVSDQYCHKCPGRRNSHVFTFSVTVHIIRVIFNTAHQINLQTYKSFHHCTTWVSVNGESINLTCVLYLSAFIFIFCIAITTTSVLKDTVTVEHLVRELQ